MSRSELLRVLEIMFGQEFATLESLIEKLQTLLDQRDDEVVD